MKKTIAIVIAGIVVVAIFIYFGRSSDTASIPVSELEQREPAASPGTNARMKDAPTLRASSEGETAQTFPGAEPIADEAKQAAECEALSERRRRREQLAHDSEQKDPAWAYAMEQKLREYTSRRFQTTPIEVMAIDCKTTFCDITAQGFVPESNTEFRDALEAVRKEPWNDFTGISSSHTVEGGKILYRVEVSRKQSYRTQDQHAEQEQVLACMRLLSQQDERKRALRDAEPRDVGWAGPTEQLIRQYLVAQVVKHPVERLEITCKTSYCQIKASGRGTESFLALQKAAQEVASEPWSDLRSSGGGGSGYGDEWQQDYTLDRRASN
jgi:hypothetical protein